MWCCGGVLHGVRGSEPASYWHLPLFTSVRDFRTLDLRSTAWRSLVKYDAWVARFTPSRMIMHCACLLPLENGNRRLPGTRSTRTGVVSRTPKFKPRPPTVPGLPGLPFRPPWPSRAVYAASAIQSKPSSPPTPPGRPGWNSPHVPSPHLQEVLASPGTWRIQRLSPLRVTYQGI